MAWSVVVPLSFAVAAASQLWVVWHMVRRWPSIPGRLKYHKAGWSGWGSRGWIFVTPVALIGMLVVLAGSPSMIASNPGSVVFGAALVTLFAPLVRYEMEERIAEALRLGGEPVEMSIEEALRPFKEERRP